MILSKKEQKRRSCTGKRWYEDRNTAMSAAHKMGDKLDARMRAYLCPHCGHWHIGHIKPGILTPDAAVTIYTLIDSAISTPDPLTALVLDVVQAAIAREDANAQELGIRGYKA